MVRAHAYPLNLTGRDVAISFHAHCLNPFRFCSDICGRDPSGVLWKGRIQFPLERLSQLIRNGIWSDVESERKWDELYPNSPYQLWSEDPAVLTQTVAFPNLTMLCPWCYKLGTFELKAFSHMYVTKTAACRCPSCEHEFTTSTLSAQYLKEDLKKFLSKHDSYVPLVVC